jgi:hypothetical protein
MDLIPARYDINRDVYSFRVDDATYEWAPQDLPFLLLPGLAGDRYALRRDVLNHAKATA